MATVMQEAGSADVALKPAQAVWSWKVCLHAVVPLEVVDELLGELEVVGERDVLVGERVGQLP